MPRAKKQKAGKLSIADMRKIINKKAGEEVHPSNIRPYSSMPLKLNPLMAAFV